MGELGRSTTKIDLSVAGFDAFITEQLRLAKKLYRLTGELDAFAPRKHIGNGHFEIEYDVEEARWRGIHSLDNLHARNTYMHMELNDHLGLPRPFPMYPYKRYPSRFGFTFQNEAGNYLFTNYHTEYAAKHALNLVLGDKKYRWINRRLIVTDCGISIKGETETCLETIIEYEFKGNESKWVMPEPYLTYYKRLGGHALPEPTKDDVPTPTSAPRAPRPQSEPRPDGLIALADIAEELDIDPREARQILRKSVEKPSYGWAWPANAIDKIKALLKKK